MYEKKIGLIGDGQLGRMLLTAASNWGLDLSILGSPTQSSCAPYAPYIEAGNRQNRADILRFAQGRDIISVEIEDVNADALEELEATGKEVYPQARVLRLIQDKGLQKAFFEEQGFPTAKYQLFETKEELLAARPSLPKVAKLRRGGYDGRGVQVLRKSLEQSFDAPIVLEDLVAIEKELAVLVARNPSGDIAVYPSVESEFHPEGNVVEYIFTPAAISPRLEEQVQELAKRIILALDMVGLLAVEFFLTKDGQLLINELAPRPHNSGHCSIEGNACSQFEQMLRVLLDLPLGSTALRGHAAMLNILGEAEQSGPVVYKGLHEALRIADSHLHLYGKSETRPLRKMGHFTICASSRSELLEKIQKAKGLIRAEAEN